MEEKQYPKMLISEIQEGGLGDALVREAKSNKHENGYGYVKTTNFIEWLHIMDSSMKIFGTLSKNFGMVEVLSQHNSNYKLRVMRAAKSIGFVFGLLENKKDEFNIAEYSASQTTLEQIFQMFALMSIESDDMHLRFEYD